MEYPVTVALDSTLVAAIRDGDWLELSRHLDRNPTGSEAVLPLYRVLASGDPASLEEAEPALLPQYQLRQALYPCPAAAERLTLAASRARNAGRKELAAALYKAALAFVEHHASASHALSWIAFEAGQLQFAAHHAEAAVAHGEPDADMLATYGWMLWQTKRPTDAEAALEAAISRDPANATAHWYLGYVLGETGNLPRSEEVLRRAIELAPQHAEAKVTLAWTLAHQGRLEEAIGFSRHAVERERLPHRLSQLGHLLNERGETRQAVGYLLEALQARPQDTTTRRRLALALGGLGQIAEARLLVEEGLEDTPDDTTLLIAQSILLSQEGDRNAASLRLRDLLERRPDLSEAWYLLGKLQSETPVAAEECFAKAQELAPTFTAAILERARVLLQLHNAEGAGWLMEVLLQRVPALVEARQLYAHALLELKQPEKARVELHRILREDGAAGAQFWTLLSVAQQRTGRRRAAAQAVRKALGVDRRDVGALRQSAELALASGRLSDAVAFAHELLRVVPDEPEALILASFAIQESGDTHAAAILAERAVACAPDKADAWRSLGNVRHHQGQAGAAEEAYHQAIRIAPERWEAMVSLAWVLANDDRLPEAMIIVARACEQGPDAAATWTARAQIAGVYGRHEIALESARRALELRPKHLDGMYLLAEQLFYRGQAALLSSRDQSWREAAGHLADVLRRDPRHHSSCLLAVRLAVADEAHGDLLRLMPRDRRRESVVELLEWLAAFGGAEECGRTAALARAWFPEDAQIAIACHHLDAMAGLVDAEEIGAALRQWELDHREARAPRKTLPFPAATPGTRLRVAYLASHLHQSLLSGIFAAHDHRRVELHLYTDDPVSLPADIRNRVIVHPLADTDLEGSCAANGIEIVVDTVGLHPFHGQYKVLSALRRRIAPLQCGWVGAWAQGGGLFDLQIADAISIPADQDGHYDADILRLPGGQWHWSPPLGAPAVSELPASRRGRVTFGVDVRGYRISEACIECWVDLLAALPDADMRFLGRHARDHAFRQRLNTLLAARGIAASRVSFEFHRPYGEHFSFFHSVDIALDTFPANGGLSLVDSLWMGVPVVTLSGAGLAAERQGASILYSVQCPQWVASDRDDYLRIAKALAGDVDGLISIRASLRQRIMASPLVDAGRITAHLEQSWFAMRDELAAERLLDDPKSRSRTIAKRRIGSWLSTSANLVLPQSDAPDVSVIIILYNQAGLTLRALQALADQRGCGFETIIVDNASSDETGALLDRIHGATIIRNTENVGFLQAVNQAAAQARGRHILLLNNDAYLHADAVSAAARRLDNDMSAGAVGGKIVLVDGRLQEAGCVAFADGSTVGYGRDQNPSDAEYRFVRQVDFVSGVFLMVRKSLWDMLGGFDPIYAPAYYEDTDLCFRIRKAGFRVLYDPAVKAVHLEWGSATTANAATEMMQRNAGVFAERHGDMLASAALPSTYKPARDRWAAEGEPRVLILDNSVPHQRGGGGQPRARLMANSIEGCSVTFYPLWAPDEDWQDVYASLPDDMEVVLHRGARGLERFLDERLGLYDVIIVSRPPNMKLVNDLRARRPSLFRDSRVVFDTEAIFALRDIAKARAEGVPMARQEASALLRQELSLAADVDAVICVSAMEERLYRAAGVKQLYLMPHAGAVRRDVPDHGARQGLLFIGALNPDTPNEDSLVWFVEEILPILNRLLGEKVPVTIVGTCRSSAVSQLASDQVRLVGGVDDLDPHYDAARVFIAPTRYSAGVPAKVIEASLAGVPVVATTLLARQLGWRKGEVILAEDQPDAFAEAIARLYRDPELWRRMVDAAQKRCEDQVSPQAFSRGLAAAISGREQS
jgi:predicted O-linked N-acetylglucosamine transferase (SPINDLY family)/GT2 family glycosyltransferase/glycosyltransferase involved in cell wall biosynthesis